MYTCTQENSKPIIYNGPGTKHFAKIFKDFDANKCTKLLKLNVQFVDGGRKYSYFRITSITTIDLFLGTICFTALDQVGDLYKIFYNADDKSGYLNKL
jgi:hypothetical protein